MIICITGASGFIGKNLVKYLHRKGHKLHCLVRKNYNGSNRSFLNQYATLVSDDIKLCVTNANVVINLIGQLGQFGITKEQYEKANITSVQNLLAHCSHQKIIHISTTGIYGPCISADETTPPSPQNLYEETKLKSELLVRTYHKYIIIRLGWVLGPYDLHALPIYKMINRRLFPMIGNGQNKIQPLYVDDLTFALGKLINTDITNDIIIIAGQSLTFEQLFRYIAKALNQKLFLVKISPRIALSLISMIRFLSKILPLKTSIRREAIAFFTEERTYCTSKIEKMINFKATPIIPAITSAINFYRKNKLL